MKFPDGWKIIKLNDVAVPLNRRNTIGNRNVLTSSAQFGLINQLEYHNRSMAGEDLSSYYLLCNGDFAYNRSSAKGYPFGAIRRLDKYDTGIVSSLYIPFALKKDSCFSDFLSYVLDSDVINQYLYRVCQEGARNHGLLNIAKEDFFQMPLYFPICKNEQRRIAEFLGTWDEAIEKLERLIAAKEMRLNWIRFHILTGRIRLDKYSKKWELQRLSNILHEHGTKSSGHEVVHSVSVHKGVVNQIEHLGRNFSAKDTSNYNLAKSGDIIYTKSPTGDFPYGIIKMNQNKYNVIVSPLYGVFTPAYPELGIWLDCYFEAPENTNNYLHPIIQKGAKNTINITNKTFLSNTLYLPTERAEVQAICRIISMVKTELKLLQQELAALQKQKRGLMQKLLTGTWRV